MERIGELWNELRYDRPGTYRVLVGTVVMLLIMSVFMALPDMPILRAMGITGVQQKIRACGYGIVWSTRAALHRSGSEEHTRQFGNIEGIDKSGRLITTLAKGAEWSHDSLVMANIEVTDVYGVAKLVAGLRSENARFDIYPGGQVVVWIRNAPLNLKLIEAGVAAPDSMPPSNIFDQAFATYYWGVVKGRTE